MFSKTLPPHLQRRFLKTRYISNYPNWALNTCNLVLNGGKCLLPFWLVSLKPEFCDYLILYPKFLCNDIQLTAIK